ncbi:hypothetical protein, partial [Bradyrhizobium sp.]|uniref:hypothetical protein n=1 Tax=Bradyrhizobium sp. TaxID=376 RepID=UPI00391A5BE3
RAAGHAASAGGKPPRVVMTSCFGLCPKRAVVVTGGVGAARGDSALVSSPNDVPGALRLLQLSPHRSP